MVPDHRGSGIPSVCVCVCVCNWDVRPRACHSLGLTYGTGSRFPDVRYVKLREGKEKESELYCNPHLTCESH